MRERDLVAAAEQGELLRWTELSPDELRMAGGEEHNVRASLIRDLLSGQHGDLDPRGLQLRGARITGQLDLDGLRSSARLTLSDCWFEHTLLARGAHFPQFDLSGSHLPALHADGIRVDGMMFLRDGFQVQANDPLGAVRVPGAKIGGSLDLGNAHLHNTTDGPALDADALRVDGCVFLHNGFTAVADSADGAVRLISAQVGDAVDCDGASVRNSIGPALYGDRMEVNGGVFLRDGFTATARSSRGAVRLRGAHIGSLTCRSATVINTAGAALEASELRVDTGVTLHGRFVASAGGIDAAVLLVSAEIGGNLECIGSELRNSSGVALRAEQMTVNGSMFLRKGFTAWASSPRGAVRLLGTRVRGDLSCVGARLTNQTGPALGADGLHVSGSILLRQGFTARGDHHGATLEMDGVQADGIDCTDARLHNLNGPVLNLSHATTTWARWPDDLLCSAPAGHQCEDGSQLVLNGFTYRTLTGDGASWQRWLHWLRHHTPDYAAQPYQRLATVEREAGHDAATRHILIAQQHDLLRRGDVGGKLARLRHRTWGAVAGYGYRPGRIAAALLGVLILSGLLGFAAGHTPTRDGRYAMLHTARAEHPYTPCSTVEQIGSGIDRGLPIGTTGIRDRCDLDTTSRRGQAFTAAIWFLQAFTWALATLTITGYTGLIRKIT